MFKHKVSESRGGSITMLGQPLHLPGTSIFRWTSWKVKHPRTHIDIRFSVYVHKTCLYFGAMSSRNTLYLASVAYSITTFLKHEWQIGVSKPYGSCWEEFQKVRQKMEINLRRAWSGRPRPKFHCSAQQMKVCVELKSYIQ